MKYTIIILSLSSLFSCNSSKQSAADKPKTDTVNSATTTSNNGAQEVAVISTADTLPKPKAFVYRFVVSFISIGEGIDQNAKKTLDDHLVQWRNNTGKAIHSEEVHWGREGETDYCFP